ncbi:MAG: hypothetical protein U1B80_04355, partial [Anaerolineaceae bacterium]|nr:hypothetical protein [Anaerolineaceae bacterium]
LSTRTVETAAGLSAVDSSLPGIGFEQPALEPGGGPAFPIAGLELPDWLIETRGEAEVPHEEPAETGYLTPTELPGWLEALRPVEGEARAVVIERSEEIAPTSGPLAGFGGVLAGVGPPIARKIAGDTGKLRISDKQRAHAEMLEKVLADETLPQAVSPELVQTPPRWLRWMVSVVLIVVLIAAGFIPNAASGLYPSSYLNDFIQRVVAIPEGKAVLVAVEYEPGFSGELRLAAQEALSQLMAKKVRLALISTVPSGPALGEQLLTDASGRLDAAGVEVDPGYLSRANSRTLVVNLGYLPAGSASLQEFAIRPRQASSQGLLHDPDGAQVWEHPALAGVERLSDFSAVIVAVDSLDSGRAWVEQVQPSLAEVPLLIVASAQAAPLLEPYLASGQISGMVAGFSGALSYQELSQPSAAAGFLNAYRAGLLLAVLLIIVGALIHSAATLAGRGKT